MKSLKTKWKILLTDGLHEQGQLILRANARLDDQTGITPGKLLDVIGGYDAIILRGSTRITAELIEVGVHLKVIGRSGVGVDNIDLQAAARHQVIVVNAPHSSSVAVAELTLGLMLALARSIPRADGNMKQGIWDKGQLTGSELFGKELGIIGMGNIGRAVASRAIALGMQVLGYDPYLSYEVISKTGIRPTQLTELYARSDFITIHAPLTKETNQLVDKNAFSLVKPGVYMICTARGGIIDEAALLDALASGRVAGAALDVFDQEPPGKTDLVCHPNLIATPHIGAQTNEAQKRAAVDIAEEVLAALGGKPLRWRVA